ncbi:MAG TPA: alpha-glucosidase [Terriglobales bacterium]|nr:alpha-glucosidase [Terriglobales bacterium]
MLTTIKKSIYVFIAVNILAISAPAQTQSPTTGGHDWWKHSVFYEIYPRSFADTNNDGIGDLKGIDAHLEYLRDLGVDAIWITPCYPSPQVDFGYDVADYENIDPMYGTLKDFDDLATDAKKRGIRIIMDFVLNHTSPQHKWFIDSASSRTSAHRDWYIWRDGKAPGVPPNNWISGFGGSAWQFDPKTGQYYYHFFAVGQPDLNWRNPAVENAMFDVTRFWYKRGVSGFRLDAVDLLFEDPELHDNPILEGKNDLGDPNMVNKYNDKLPEVHTELKKLRKVADEYDAVLVGETYTANREELKEYYGGSNDEIQMPMDFMFCEVNKLSPTDFRKQIANVESTGGWPVYVIGNHDMARSYNRYGDAVHNDQIAKLMAGMYLTLRGTPIMYYGEELGMENNDPVHKEDVKDPIGIAGWPSEKGRDGERTPMQWNESANAGFSVSKPWLPVPASYKTHNVARELKEPDSVLQFYKRLLAFRHQEPALLDGDYVALDQDNPDVLSYLRRYNDQGVLVVLNMSGKNQQVGFNLSSEGFASAKLTALLTTQSASSVKSVDKISLEPFAVYIARLSR